jgi:hypothetical protein
LYGFADAAERALFPQLLGVGGVDRDAPEPFRCWGRSRLAAAIEAGDEAVIARVPRLGRKTAQRIVIELAGRSWRLPEPGTHGDAVLLDGLDVDGLTRSGGGAWCGAAGRSRSGRRDIVAGTRARREANDRDDVDEPAAVHRCGLRRCWSDGGRARRRRHRPSARRRSGRETVASAAVYIMLVLVLTSLLIFEQRRARSAAVRLNALEERLVAQERGTVRGERAGLTHGLPNRLAFYELLRADLTDALRGRQPLSCT